MPQPRRSLRSGLASLLAAFGSLACGGERTTQRVVGDECDNGITLRVADWGDPALEAAYLAAAQRFVLAQPCVAVEVEIVPVSNHAEYLDWLRGETAAGTAPDVVNLANENLRAAVDAGLLAPLDSLMSDDRATSWFADYSADVDDRLVDALAVDGTQYLLPIDWNSMLIFINTDVFEAAGIERPSDDWTWDEFLALAQRLTAGSGDDRVVGFAVPSFHFAMTPWYSSAGTSPVDADLLGSNLDDPAMAEAAQFVADLINVHGAAATVEGTDPYQLFRDGRAAMTGAGRWLVGPFAEQGFSAYDVVTWPTGRERSTVAGVAGFGVHAGASDPALAWRLVQELLAVPTAQAISELGLSVPARDSVLETTSFAKEPASHELFRASLGDASPIAAPANFHDLDALMDRAVAEILAGERPATEVFTEAHVLLQRLFDGG